MRVLNRPTGTTGKATDIEEVIYIAYIINSQIKPLHNLVTVCLREQMLGEDHRPLVVRKGKSLKEEVKRRDAPPETPVVDVSTFIS